MTPQKQIQEAIFTLLRTKPYYAHFVMDSKIVYCEKTLPTAGVVVRSAIPTFYFNPKFLSELSTIEVAGLLEHEIMHLLLHHVHDKSEDGLDHYVRNIAQDCTINQHIEKLPEGGVTLPFLESICKKKLEPFQTSDYYYAMLKEFKEQLQKAGASTTDDHSLEGDPAEIARAVVKKVSQNAINQAAGNVPKHILDATAQLGEAKLPWQSLLRNSIMSQVSRKTQATTKKINRRFALPVPGKKHKREMVLGVCVDESGSVSDEQFAAFASEINQIAKQLTKVYVVHADCEVAAIDDLSKTAFKAVRKAGGGTAYQPAIDKCRELKCNMIIYFGDFDTADKPVNPGVPFIWVGVGNSPAPASFGKVIRL